MVDAMSLSTTAAARQNEMNASATVVATTTLVVVAGLRTAGVFMLLAIRADFGNTLTVGLELLPLMQPRIQNNDLMAISPQNPGEPLLAVAPPMFAPSDHDNGIRCERPEYRLFAIAAK